MESGQSMYRLFKVVIFLAIIISKPILAQEIWSPVHPIGIDNPVTVNDSVLLSGVKSSVDGVNWTIGSPDTFMVLSSSSGVCSDQYYYYAASYHGYVWYSKDLKTWSYRKVLEGKKIIDFTLHERTFFIIADEDTERYLYTGRSTSSMDSVAPLPNDVNSLYMCGTKIYAIGDSTTYSSTDSMNWALETEYSFTRIVNTPICNIGLKGGATLSIAAGDTDLWSDVNVDVASSEKILDVDYCNSKLVAITGTQSYSSVDSGKTWQKLSDQSDHPKLKDLYHIKKSGDSESTLFATGDYFNGAIYTFNNENNQWVNVAKGMEDTVKSIRGLANNDSIIVGVSSRSVIITSNDSGATWKSINFPNHYMRSYPVFYKDSFYVISKINGAETGDPDTNVILTSGNGVDWNVKELSQGHDFNALGVHQNKLVAGARAKIWTSEDGLSWNEISVPDGDREGLFPNINCIASNGKTIACLYYYTGVVVYSNDLETWNTSYTNASYLLDIYPNMITTNGTNFIAASSAEHQTAMLDTSSFWTNYEHSGTDYGLHFRIGNEYAATWHNLFTFSKDGDIGRKKYSAPFSGPEGFCYMGDRLIVVAYNGIFTSENVNGVVDPVAIKPVSFKKYGFNSIVIKKGALISTKIPIKKIRLFAMNGKVVYAKNYKDANNIKLPELASGVYKINVTFSDNSFKVVQYLNIR